MAGITNKTDTCLLNLAKLVHPAFFKPPPGLEMFGPGSVVMMQEAKDAQSKRCDKDSSISACSTPDAWGAEDYASSASSDYCAGDVLRMSARLSSGGLELTAHSQQPIQLEKAFPEEACGSPGCPSLGSAGHYLGMCRPCDFMYRGDGCRAGSKCQFCHLCPRGELQRRKKEKRAAARMITCMTACEVWPQTFGAAMTLSIHQQL
eukprot:TRINITY_DN4777_c0_g2_i1.p1 TRINITY_DN4777_c0_g2~~TRINITY_DN4777_c0_g2_i1.p1  ORF type:complete len:205 (-),score=30.76 TRINITY_DN4777_c0_g2_i1:474-1088(-)